MKSRVDELNFFGTKALYTMNDQAVAEISISRNGTSGNYPCLYVTIQNKINGTIAENRFMFNEYLERDESHPNAKQEKGMYIWTNGKDIDWYIVRPVTTKPIVDAIFNYIEVYQFYT